jgi:hypothetical protein
MIINPYNFGGLDAAAVTYAVNAGMTEESTLKLSNLLKTLEGLAGVRPDFLWLGGSNYNRADQRLSVIGDTATVIATSGPSPVADGPNSCRFNRSDPFQFTNPAALKSTAVQEMCWIVWYESIDDGVTTEVVNTHNSAAQGPRLRLQSAPTPSVAFVTGTDGATGPKTLTLSNQPINSRMVGMRRLLMHWKITAGVGRQYILNDVYDYNDGGVNTFTGLFNNNGLITVGSFDGAGTNVGTFPTRFANMRIYGIAMLRALSDTTTKTRRKLADALWTSGVRPPDPFAFLVTVGDSQMANGWNREFVSATGIRGGAWNGITRLDEYALGGSDMAYIVTNTSNIRSALDTKAYQYKYLVYAVEPGDTVTSGGWSAIGVTPEDFDGLYQWIENWALDLEATTGCEVVLVSRIRPNNAANNSATAYENWRDYVYDMCDRNGWHFVDHWSCPHSKIYTGSIPGSYGFFTDEFHPTQAGAAILAEVTAASLPHPYSTAPRLDITAPPVISGIEEDGETLSVTTGTWINSPDSYTYQWLNNLATISGATASTYVLQAGDVGDRIACRVTAVKAGHNSASYTAAPTGIIAA